MIQPLDWNQLNDAMDLLENHWKQEIPSDLKAFLPADTPQNQISAWMVEFIKLDLEMRWRKKVALHGDWDSLSCKLPTIANYQERYGNQLFQHDQVIDLLVEEYRARVRWGDQPSIDFFLSLHEQQRTELKPLLQRVLRDLESTAPRAIGSTNGPSLDKEVTAKEDVKDLPSIPNILVESVIGRGGMGIVYRAHDIALNRPIAVKVLRAKFLNSSELIRRFVSEAQICGQLQHAGIPPIHLIGELADGRPFLAMRLIKGTTLDVICQPSQPRPDLAIFESICQTLSYAHSRGVIHRDLKPSNIMVGKYGDVQILDWGLAKVVSDDLAATTTATSDSWRSETEYPSMVRTDSSTDEHSTQAGSIVGTPAFMPPEQAAGEHALVSTRSDVFGLGAILCFILTGDPPFEGQDMESVRRNAIRGNLTKAFQRLDDCGADREIIELCKRCLAIEPNDRPSDATQVVAELARYRQGVSERLIQADRARVRAETLSIAEKKRKKTLMIASGLTMLVLAIGVAGTTLGMLKAQKASFEASQASQREAEERHKAELALQNSLASEKAVKQKANETELILAFVQEKILSAARPAGVDGGLGRDVTLYQALLQALPDIDTRFQHQPQIEARLRETLGSTLMLLGEFGKAEEQFHRSQDLFQDLYGNHHVETARAAYHRASALGQAFQVEAAMEILQALEKDVRELDPPNHHLSLGVQSALSNCLYLMNRVQESYEVAERQVQLTKEVLGPSDPMTLNASANIINMLAELGRMEEARDRSLVLIPILETHLGPNHTTTLSTKNNLADIFFQLKQFDESLQLNQEVATNLKNQLGPSHLTTLNSLFGLARSYFQAGQEELGQQVIDECLTQLQPPIQDIRLVRQLHTLRAERYSLLGNTSGLQDVAKSLESYALQDAEVHYTVAAIWAVASQNATEEGESETAAGNTQRAIRWLEKAIHAGIRDRHRITIDPNFEPLRKVEEYQQLLDTLPND